VLVTHDPALAAHADRLVTLRDGRVVTDESTLSPQPSPPHPALSPTGGEGWGEGEKGS
jgi:ABC-type sulfate/molybdate transport systems ATPase subunit